MVQYKPDTPSKLCATGLWALPGHTILLAGGTDEGAPGPRSALPGAYAAYLRDPGGNKICSYTFV